jgi:hypothetical protein
MEGITEDARQEKVPRTVSANWHTPGLPLGDGEDQEITAFG